MFKDCSVPVTFLVPAITGYTVDLPKYHPICIMHSNVRSENLQWLQCNVCCKDYYLQYYIYNKSRIYKLNN